MSNDGAQVLMYSLADATKADGFVDQLRRDDGVIAAVVVERTPDGTLRVPDQTSGSHYLGTITGSVVGALIGVLAGPLGLLFGWAGGALIGSLSDLQDNDDTGDGLQILARGILPGTSVLIAEISDPSFPAEERATEWDATVVRIPVAEVRDEVESANAAAREAQKTASRIRRERHRADFAAHMRRLFHRQQPGS